MKFLVAYSGHSRSYKETLKTHVSFLLNPLREKKFSIDTRLLIHEKIDENNDIDVDVDFIRKTLEDFNTTIKIITKDENYQISKKINEELKNITGVTSSRGFSGLVPISTMCYYIQKSLESSENFDYTVKARLDQRFLTSIDPTVFESKFDIYSPEFGHFGGLNDQFYAISSKVKCRPFDFLSKINHLHPETMLKNSLSGQNLKISYEKSFNYYLERTNGDINDQRAFDIKKGTELFK